MLSRECPHEPPLITRLSDRVGVSNHALPSVGADAKLSCQSSATHSEALRTLSMAPNGLTPSGLLPTSMGPPVPHPQPPEYMTAWLQSTAGVFPHGTFLPSSLRAALSHSDLVASLLPAHVQY